MLATRADDAARAAVREVAPEAEEDELARCIWVARGMPEPRGVVAVVSAGTSDGPVVREARIRAELLGTTVVVHEDVGVAGVHRLATALPDLERADCVVVVAGMDGALASLVGGLAPRPGDRRADERRLRLGARRDDGAERDARVVRRRARGRRDRRRARRRDDRGTHRAGPRVTPRRLPRLRRRARRRHAARGAPRRGRRARDAPRRVPARSASRACEIDVERVERQGIGALHLRIDAARRPRASRLRARSASSSRRPTCPERARARSLEAFRRLAEVEGGIHGVPPEDVHFHELGSLDTLVDVCGAFVLLDELGVERVVSSPLPFARGFVKAAHGVLPLPAPATLGLLEGAALVGVETEAELVTPTGAAIAATVVEEWGALPPLTLEPCRLRRRHEGPRRPAERRPGRPRHGVASCTAQVVLLETNLDDFSPELVPDAVERCFAAGALDVWTVPAQMKKGRPGFVLSALARPDAQGEIARVLLEETSALGVRVSRLERYELEREERVVELEGGTVRVKVGLLDGRVVNLAPEHDDCAALARATGRSVKSVWAEALARAQQP